MARTATGNPPPATAARPRPRRKPQLAWLKAGDARLVISHQDAQDRHILQALDTLVRARQPAPAKRRRTLAA